MLGKIHYVCWVASQARTLKTRIKNDCLPSTVLEHMVETESWTDVVQGRSILKEIKKQICFLYSIPWWTVVTAL